jgi:hypothetical protein
VLLLASVLFAVDLPPDNILRGPYSFLRDNELSIHGGYSAGFGDTFAGPKGAVDYGYRLAGGWWLDLEGGWTAASCGAHRKEGPCGGAAEVLAGVKWKLRMNVPVVPYVKALAGLAYLFPNGTKAGLGPLLRAGLGAHYFFYEWFGVGLEVTTAVGHAGYPSGSGLSRGLAGLDFTAGAELAF